MQLPQQEARYENCDNNNYTSHRRHTNFFTLKGSIDASRWVSVICLRLSRLMKYSPKIAEINNDKMIAINERNET